MYDTSIEYIKISYLKGVSKQIRETEYYRLLPPKIKNDLIFQILEDYYEKFYYFFYDAELMITAEETFIRKILSHLDC